jgi:UDP-glucose 4-epimerase
MEREPSGFGGKAIQPCASTMPRAPLAVGLLGCVENRYSSRQHGFGSARTGGGREQRRMSMTIMVTGGAGYIGSHMAYTLVDAGERVVVLDDFSTGFDWAVPKAATLVVGNVGDEALVMNVIAKNDIDAIIHFAGSIVVPESVADPLGYYRNNTANSRTLIECAVKGGIKHFIFSSTAAVYGNPARVPVPETDPTIPMSPYGSSKLMTEMMLRDASAAHGLAHVILRYFNVAGADPKQRTGQSTKGATHLIKVAVETALGLRPKMHVFGTDYPTPDGTCIRDYIHVCDLVRAHSDALTYLRQGGASTTLNCGYGRGFSVIEVIDTVKRVSGVDFRVDTAPRRAGDPAQIVAKSDRIRALLGWQPQFDDLATIVRHALAWERMLAERRDGKTTPRAATG